MVGVGVESSFIFPPKYSTFHESFKQPMLLTDCSSRLLLELPRRSVSPVIIRKAQGLPPSKVITCIPQVGKNAKGYSILSKGTCNMKTAPRKQTIACTGVLMTKPVLSFAKRSVLFWLAPREKFLLHNILSGSFPQPLEFCNSYLSYPS